MAIFDGNMPYTILHELNLDWITKNLKQIKDKTDVIDEAVERAETSATIALESKERSEEILNSINNIFVTPEMYGAAGDGVTDDTTAFQNAIDSGYVVKLSNKTYYVTGLEINNSGTAIYGSGSAKTLIKSSGGIAISNSSNVKLKGFTLWSGLVLTDERSVNDGTGINFIVGSNPNSITREQLDDLIISGYYIGIDSDDFWTISISNTRIDYCGIAFSMTRGFNGNFTNCYFTSTNDKLFYIYNRRTELMFNACNFGIKDTDAFTVANGEDSTFLFNACNLECDQEVIAKTGRPSKYIFYAEKGSFVFNSSILWSNIGTSDVYFFRGGNLTHYVLNETIQHLYSGSYSSNWFNTANSVLVDINNVGNMPLFDIRDQAPTNYTVGTVYFDTTDNSLKIRYNSAWKRIGTGTVVSATQPTDDIGQLWVNGTDVSIQIADRSYVPLNCIVSGTAPTTYNVGTLWFDTSINKLKIRASGTWNTIG